MLDTASAHRAYPPMNGCRLLWPRSRLAAAIVFTAIFTIFTIGTVFTSLAAGSRPYFSVGRPPVKRLGCCGESNIHFLTRSEVNRRCRSEFDSIRQVNLNPNLLQGTVSGVFHRAVKGVALGVVARTSRAPFRTVSYRSVRVRVLPDSSPSLALPCSLRHRCRHLHHLRHRSRVHQPRRRFPAPPQRGASTRQTWAVAGRVTSTF